MAFDENCNDLPFLVGRLTAKVEEILGAANLPEAFAAKVNVNTLQKLPFHLNKALAISDDPTLISLVSRIDGQFNYVDSRGQFWVGYYHQKNADSRRTMGEKIAQLRKQRGLTQDALADMTGMKRTNISRI
jgi:hypothetical protein